MADEPPKKASFRIGGFWQCARRDTAYGLDRRVETHREIGPSNADGHLDRQMPVGAKRFDAQLTKLRSVRRAVCVHERKKYFCAGIRRFLAREALMLGQQAWHSIGRIIANSAGIGVLGQ